MTEPPSQDPDAVKELCDLFARATDAVFKGKGATAVGQLQKALRMLEGGLDRLDNNFFLTLLFPWSDLFWAIDRPDLVLQVYDVIDREMPEDPHIALHRAIALFHLARFDEAYDLLSDLEDRGYPAADLHFFLGCLAERAEREATAQSHFQRAATLEPERYCVPMERDEATVREALKKLIGQASGSVQTMLRRARVVIEPLPSDEQLYGETARVDPLALTLVEPATTRKGARRAEIGSIHLFLKNIDKAVAEGEDLEERLGEALTRELSVVLEQNEDDLRRQFAPPKK